MINTPKDDKIVKNVWVKYFWIKIKILYDLYFELLNINTICQNYRLIVKFEWLTIYSLVKFVA